MISKLKPQFMFSQKKHILSYSRKDVLKLLEQKFYYTNKKKESNNMKNESLLRLLIYDRYYNYNNNKIDSNNNYIKCKKILSTDTKYNYSPICKYNKKINDISYFSVPFKINIRNLGTSNFVKNKKDVIDNDYIYENIKKEKSKHKKIIFLLFVSLFGLYGFFESYNPEFFLYDIFLKFCLKYIDGEICHDLFLLLGKYNILPYDTSNDSIYASANIKHLDFINPFGVAAGFDKNGVCIDSILKLGFSFIEIGTITPKGQKGNPKPRIFRDVESRSVINSCGFNNMGCDKVTENLIHFRKRQEKDKLLSKHIVGVSIGKNKDTVNIVDDLKYCINKIGRYADYIAINVSSPNTPGLRDNQEAGKLKNIILSVKQEIDNLEKNNIVNDENTYNEDKIGETKNFNKNNSDIMKDSNDKVLWFNTTKKKPLVFVKLAPDLNQEQKKEIAEVLLETNIDGMIISNTTTQINDIKSFENKKGGVSGAKLKDISTKFICEMYNYTNKQIPIIASGGIFSGLDALEKIEAGASVCQLYSCLVFNGMKSAVQIKRELNHLLYQRGYYNLKEAIGRKHSKS
ncbi:dihydroorotate dehydrogenase, mitochondrial precursor [Plasmodium sp. DRC-Itaito]|nr:dihydroorotate dehydrogenase, mitochondrial precursor [Plasmodium sp. DRC-Itaito]